MPTGWSGGSPTDPTGGGACNTPSLNDEFPPSAKASTEFVMGKDVPTFMEQLLSYGTSSEAQTVLDKFDRERSLLH